MKTIKTHSNITSHL